MQLPLGPGLDGGLPRERSKVVVGQRDADGMKSATRRPFPGRKARPSPGAPQAVGDGGEAMRVRTAGISRAEVNSYQGATKVEWLAGPDAIARCHAHPRNSDARRTPAHRPT